MPIETECFLDVVKKSSISKRIIETGCENVIHFVKLIEDKLKILYVEKKNTDTLVGDINKVGCIILQELIKKKLSDISKDNDTLEKIRLEVGVSSKSDVLDNIATRLSYFDKPEFMDKFMKNLPSGGSFASEGTKSGYTDYIKNLFNTTITNVRKEVEPIAATSQCKRALKLTAKDVRNLPYDKTMTCYLCGCPMLRGQSLECEHILPILPALSHLWLIRGERDVERDEKLSLEYAWTHECCNQWKSNIEFIETDITKEHGIASKDIYKISETQIDDFIVILKKGFTKTTARAKSSLYACDEIVCSNNSFPGINAKETIVKKLNPIVDQININLQEIENATSSKELKDVNYIFYLLLCKFKFLAAFSDDTFLKHLVLAYPNKGSTVETAEEKQAYKDYIDAKAAIGIPETFLKSIDDLRDVIHVYNTLKSGRNPRNQKKIEVIINGWSELSNEDKISSLLEYINKNYKYIKSLWIDIKEAQVICKEKYYDFQDERELSGKPRNISPDCSITNRPIITKAITKLENVYDMLKQDKYTGNPDHLDRSGSETTGDPELGIDDWWASITPLDEIIQKYGNHEDFVGGNYSNTKAEISIEKPKHLVLRLLDKHNIDQNNIILDLLTNPKYDPTEKEINNIFDKIFKKIKEPQTKSSQGGRSKKTKKIINQRYRKKTHKRKIKKTKNKKTKNNISKKNIQIAGASILGRCYVENLPNNNLKLILGRRKYTTKHLANNLVAKNYINEVANDPMRKNKCIAIARLFDNEVKLSKKSYKN